MSTLLTATELTVRYGDRAVLEGATLAIEEGDRIGLVGRNGCGKTTFLRILAGLQSPDRGDVSRRRIGHACHPVAGLGSAADTAAALRRSEEERQRLIERA